MHGRVKVRTTAEQEEIKKKERAKKVVQYKVAIVTIFQKRKDQIWDNELLSLTEGILLQNPDVYTLWNIRREVFQNNNWNEQDYVNILEKELTLTENCLKNNPKSYSIWHQRCWIMEHLPKPNWERELLLCSKCLNIDERNFHCWDYRQYVVEMAKISDQEEYDFSTTKILSNFSNYSSWHYRSKILSKMFLSHFKELSVIQEKQKEELEFVMNATFTDPNDSSAWFYQRWLLEDYVTKPSCTMWRAYITQDTAMCVFNDEILPKTVSLLVNGNEINTQWKPYERKQYSKIWTTTFTDSPQDLDKAEVVSVKIEDKIYELYYSYIENAWLYKSDVSSEENHNQEQLKEQLENYKELAKMEPNNKWALLIGIFLMRKINFMQYHESILKDINTLANIDSLRHNYYKDLYSKYLLEYTLYKVWKEETKLEIQKTIDLSGLDLTTLRNNQYFSFFEEVNLSGNNLELSLHQLSCLQQCKRLSLSSNHLQSVKNFPLLSNLEFLSLRNNKLSNINEIVNLIKRNGLKKLDLRDNPVYELCKNGAIVKEINTTIELLKENDE